MGQAHLRLAVQACRIGEHLEMGKTGTSGNCKFAGQSSQVKLSRRLPEEPPRHSEVPISTGEDDAEPTLNAVDRWF